MLPVVFFLLKKLIQPKKSNKNGKMTLIGKYFFRMGSPIRVVFYSFFGSKLTIAKKISNNNGRILVWLVKIDDEIYFLVSLYSCHTEPEQLETLHELETILLKFDANEYSHIIFSCVFKIFFNASLEATGRNAVLN